MTFGFVAANHIFERSSNQPPQKPARAKAATAGS
jgi:hypothetical protein